MKRAFSCLIALSLWVVPLGAVEPALAAPAATVDYRPTSQTLVVEVPDGVVPGIQELSNPPRFVVDLPGAPPARPVDRVFAEGLVQRFVAVRRGDGTRIVLHLRAPLRDAWAVRMDGRRLAFVFSPKAPLPPRPTPVSAGKTPPPMPTPRPTVRPTPRPTAKPTPRVTAPPTPAPTAVPQLTPIDVPDEPEATGAALPSPSIAPIAAAPPRPTPVPATPRPTARPSATPALKTPPPKPTPSPRPKATPTPAPRPGVKAVRPATGNYVRAGKFTYDEATRFFTVPLSSRVTPAFSMEDAPTQLVMDLPGTVVGPTQSRTYPGALVTEATAYQHTATSTRVVLTLARPIGQNWSLKQTGGKLILIFDHRPATLPQAARPVVRPSAATPRAAKPASPRPVPARPSPVAAPHAGKTFPFSGSIFSINSGAPIVGATVTVGGRAAKSNRDGQFSFPALPAGRHAVTVTASGFASQKFNIVVPDDRSLSLNLVPSL